MPIGHRRKRLLLAGILVVVVCVILWQYVVATSPVTITYAVEAAQQFYPKENNSINITCSNNGVRDAHFFIVLRLRNASLSTQTEQPYVQIDGSTIKFPFTLPRANSVLKPVFFLINNNATDFSFQVNFEKIDQTPLYGEITWYGFGYKWNETGRFFQHSQLMGSVT
jgi:hypothetical protein